MIYVKFQIFTGSFLSEKRPVLSNGNNIGWDDYGDGKYLT